MWKDIKVFGVKYSWCVQEGALRVYDEDDTTSPHEKRFYTLYRYDERTSCHTLVHVEDHITQQEAGAYIRKALRADAVYKLK